MKNNSILFFKLNIATVEKEICAISIIKLIAVGVDGEFQILRNHAPFLTRLVPGCVFYIDVINNQWDGLVLSGGILETQPGQVFIFADTVVRSTEIDFENLKKEEIEMLSKLSLIKKDSNDKINYDSVKTNLLLNFFFFFFFFFLL